MKIYSIRNHQEIHMEIQMKIQRERNETRKLMKIAKEYS